MLISARWLNDYLRPADVTADEAERVITNAAFPVESVTPTPDASDHVLDVEVTSNRGDCLSHIAIAREIAAVTGRTLTLPPTLAAGANAPPDALRAICSLENHVPDACPLFTARVIRGVRVGPSPAWLCQRLEAIGQRPINNVVDATNFLTHETGNPCHVFDLGVLAGRSLIVRRAAPGEALRLLDSRDIKLDPADVVVADAHRPVSLAGIMGGLDSSVTTRTTDVLFEVATWDPATIRRTARRLQLRTDASHRFERIVDPRTLDAAGHRAIELIHQLAGGSIVPGVLAAGAPLAPLTVIPLRLARLRSLIGADYTPQEVASVLTRLGIAVSDADPTGHSFACAVPPFRPDLTREVDLIEEIARVVGYDRIPAHDRAYVRIAPAQPTELARREIASVLTGQGFNETVTFSFVPPRHAELFLPPSRKAIELCDPRRKNDGSLRPSALPGLLACRAVNQNSRSAPDGSIRLFELSAVFAANPTSSSHDERTTLALLADAPAAPVPGSPEGGSPAFVRTQTGLRCLRGVIESLLRALNGSDAAPRFVASDPHAPAFQRDGYARVTLGTFDLGFLAVIDPRTLAHFGVATPQIAAELDLATLLESFPPRAVVKALPSFPAIERDLSIVVAEQTRWSEVESVITAWKPDLAERSVFVGAFRGGTVGPSKKSLTFRLWFRDPTRTLRDEEVAPHVARLVTMLGETLGATLRA